MAKMSMKERLAKSKAFAEQTKPQAGESTKSSGKAKPEAKAEPRQEPANAEKLESTPEDVAQTGTLVVEGIPIPAGFGVSPEEKTTHGVKIDVELHAELSEYVTKKRQYYANFVGRLVRKSLIAKWDLQDGKKIATDKDAYVEFFKTDPGLATAIAAHRRQKSYSPEPQSLKHIRFNTTKELIEKLKDFCKRLGVSQSIVISYLIERGLAG